MMSNRDLDLGRMLDKHAADAAITVLTAAILQAEILIEDFPGVPVGFADGALHGIDSDAYSAGWDDALSAAVQRMTVLRTRVQERYQDAQ